MIFLKRTRLIFLCALVLVAAGMVALWPRGPKEPVYQGKKLSQWITEAGAIPTNAETELACAAINAIGTNAIPYLLSEFSAGESGLAPKLAEWASRKTGFDFGFDEGNPRRGRAVTGLYVLGTNAVAALPTLVPYLADKELHTAAAIAIVGCGESAMPYLLKAAASTNIMMHYGLILVFSQLAQHTESAIPPLIQLTQHTNAHTRRLALFGFRNVQLRADLVLPALARAVTDTEMSVQRIAAFTLGLMGERAKAAMPDLLLMMQDTNLTRASWASNALHRIDPAALPRAAAR